MPRVVGEVVGEVRPAEDVVAAGAGAVSVGHGTAAARAHEAGMIDTEDEGRGGFMASDLQLQFAL